VADESKTKIPPLVCHERDGDSEKWEILDLAIVEGYTYERKGGHKEVEVLDLPFAKVLEAERNEDGETGFRFIHVPFVTVAERDLDDDVNSFRLVDVPFFQLVETENDDNGDFDRQVLDIPIFGPLIRHKREGERESARFLFFKRSWNVDADKSPAERPDRPRRSNARRD
jgi:hypothetical protein